ncbi:hypothetical protein GQ457_03G024620 [Hibiscus cannabinus]
MDFPQMFQTFLALIAAFAIPLSPALHQQITQAATSNRHDGIQNQCISLLGHRVPIEQLLNTPNRRYRHRHRQSPSQLEPLLAV